MAISGTGTQADPYIVDSVAALLQKVQENSVYIKIAKDLDCYKEDTPWQEVNWECMNVDGQNHKIDNIYVKNWCINFRCRDSSIKNIDFNITCNSLSSSASIFYLQDTMGNSINFCKINITLESTTEHIAVLHASQNWYSFNNNKIKIALKGKCASLMLLEMNSMYGYIRNSEFLLYSYDSNTSIDEINMISNYSETYVERCRFRVEVPVCKKFHILTSNSSNGQISSSYFIGNIGTEDALFKDTYSYTIQNSYIALKNHKSKVNISTNSPTSDRTTACNAINTFINAEDTNIVPVGSFIGLTEAQCKDPDYLNSIRWYVK